MFNQSTLLQTLGCTKTSTQRGPKWTWIGELIMQIIGPCGPYDLHEICFNTFAI